MKRIIIITGRNAETLLNGMTETISAMSTILDQVKRLTSQMDRLEYQIRELKKTEGCVRHVSNNRRA